MAKHCIFVVLLLLLLTHFVAARIYFIPGLGYLKEKPSPYVLGIESELEAMHIQFLTISGSHPAKTGSSFGDRIPDMIFVKEYGQKPARIFEQDIRILRVAVTIAEDLHVHPLLADEQVNVLGTSQGAVSIAQAVYFLLKYTEEFDLPKDFRINHLILAGSPVHRKSKLFRRLEAFREQKKIGIILYDAYQSQNKKGRVNDQVTGLSGRWQFGAVVRGVAFLFDALFIRKSRHPHVMASENKPTMEGFATFGEQVVSQLIKDGIQ